MNLVNLENPVILSNGLDLSSLITIVRQALAVVQPGERVLAIIPDKTRDDNTHLLFPIATEFLAGRGVAAFDALVARIDLTPPNRSFSHRFSLGFATQINQAVYATIGAAKAGAATSATAPRKRG